MSSSPACVAPLTDIGVLVTRPVEQAARMVSRLREMGARPILFPALTIVASGQVDALRAILSGIQPDDWLVFVSPTSVHFGLAALQLHAPDLALSQLNAVAVGHATATALRAAGVCNILAPEHGADSEHLLMLPEFADPSGRRVLIFRGEGGRELIADTLRALGAEVIYVECYRRICPITDPAPLRLALAELRIQAITAFSGETLDNLLLLIGPELVKQALSLPLFVPHPRIAQRARDRSFTRVITTAPGEDGLLDGLVEYFCHD
jgi:uroporphyrinogen-III synthase